MSWFENIKKAVSPINKKEFKKQAEVKHVKTRTIYRAVDEYEKEFKNDYANMVGNASSEILRKVTKQLYAKK